MTRGKLPTIPLAPRLFLAGCWGGICAAFLAAPVLAAKGHRWAGGLLYSLFSPVCHQVPARSFALYGHPCAVCHRCAGIYAGLLLASLLPYEIAFVTRDPRRRRWWAAGALAPLLLDTLLPFAGVWTNTADSRFMTGLAFGAMLGSLLAPAVAELLNETPWSRRRLGAGAPGGLS
jgi:uncharacterized membrane protein